MLLAILVRQEAKTDLVDLASHSIDARENKGD